MKGGVDEQVHVIQHEGAIDVDVDAASIALELPRNDRRCMTIANPPVPG